MNNYVQLSEQKYLNNVQLSEQIYLNHTMNNYVQHSEQIQFWWNSSST